MIGEKIPQLERLRRRLMENSSSELKISTSDLLSQSLGYPSYYQFYLDNRLTSEQIFSKPLLSEFAEQFYQLTHLNLDGNKLETLPSVFPLVVPNLKILSLVGNQFSKPQSLDCLSTMPQLEILELRNNKLSQLPNWKGTLLETLCKLDLSYNQFCSFPKIIFSMKKLSNLNLSNNNLIGEKSGFFSKQLKLFPYSIPSQSKLFVTLKELHLKQCNLNELDLNFFGKLQQLEHIDLSSNSLLEFIPPQLEWKTVKHCNLSNCKLSAFPWLFFTDQLIRLELTNNPIVFPDLQGQNLWPQLKQLQILHLERNHLIKQLPSELFLLHSLKELNLSNNQFLIDDNFINFEKLICLEKLIMLNINLKHFPKNLHCCTKLKELNLSWCQITTIPDYVFTNLIQLEVFVLSNNDISFVDENLLKKMNHLHTLDLTGNNLTQFLFCVQEMPQLKCIRMDFNNFSSQVELPESFNNWAATRIVTKFMEYASNVLPRLFLGSALSVKSKHYLKSQCKVSHILTVAKDIHPLFPNDFQYKIIPVEDNRTEKLKIYFKECIEFIDQAMALGEDNSVVVHCQAGVSRSASIVIAYVMFHKRMGYEAAFDFVQSKRPIICPNMGFIRQLIEFEKELGIESK